MPYVRSGLSQSVHHLRFEPEPLTLRAQRFAPFHEPRSGSSAKTRGNSCGGRTSSGPAWSS